MGSNGRKSGDQGPLLRPLLYGDPTHASTLFTLPLADLAGVQGKSLGAPADSYGDRGGVFTCTIEAQPDLEGRNSSTCSVGIVWNRGMLRRALIPSNIPIHRSDLCPRYLYSFNMFQ